MMLLLQYVHLLAPHCNLNDGTLNAQSKILRVATNSRESTHITATLYLHLLRTPKEVDA